MSNNTIHLASAPSLEIHRMSMAIPYLATTRTAAVAPGPVVLMKLGDVYMIVRDKDVSYTSRLAWMQENYSVIRPLNANESVTLRGTL